jgi:hypothetical protein
MGSVLPSDNCTSCEFLCEAVSVKVAMVFCSASGLSESDIDTPKMIVLRMATSAPGR